MKGGGSKIWEKVMGPMGKANFFKNKNLQKTAFSSMLGWRFTTNV